MASGTLELDFGTGASEASVDVTGLSGLSSASFIEVWPMAEASSDGSRTADEAIIDPVDFIPEFLTASSFRAHGRAREGIVAGKVPGRWATL
jgi:hypothetical protein